MPSKYTSLYSLMLLVKFKWLYIKEGKNIYSFLTTSYSSFYVALRQKNSYQIMRHIHCGCSFSIPRQDWATGEGEKEEKGCLVLHITRGVRSCRLLPGQDTVLRRDVTELEGIHMVASRGRLFCVVVHLSLTPRGRFRLFLFTHTHTGVVFVFLEV